MIPFGRDGNTELQNDEGQLGRVHLMCDMGSCGQDQTRFQEQVLLAAASPRKKRSLWHLQVFVFITQVVQFLHGKLFVNLC